ncbi:hypothetical protein [Bacillus sp. E214]|nr:hypothetical protein [Bacillus sp. E214]
MNVAAAGNEQTTRPSFPAALQNVLSVSSKRSLIKSHIYPITGLR